jgi:hypothetical protein
MAISVSLPVGKRFRTAQVPNLNSDQQTVIAALVRIPSSEGGMGDEWREVPPLAGPNGQCPQLLADAIWKFQSFWKTRGEFHLIDGVVDPGKHTIQKMNVLLGATPPSGPSPAAPDPKTTAEANKPFAIALVQQATGALLRYNLLGIGEDPEFRQKVDAALDHHFHMSDVTDPDDSRAKMELIFSNYRAVLASFANSATIWSSVTVEQAVTDNNMPAGSTNVPPAYAVTNTYVRFSPAFRPWDPARRVGQGPYTAAMILIHESIHYCDPNAPDFAYEWQSKYDNLSADEAIHNPSSYAAFAAEIRRGGDKPRPGAGNPSL